MQERCRSDIDRKGRKYVRMGLTIKLLTIGTNKCHNLNYQRSTPQDYKGYKIKKLKLLTNFQFLSLKSN